MPHWSETLDIKCVPRPLDETLDRVGEQIIDIILDDGESTVEFDITIKVPLSGKNNYHNDSEKSSKSIQTLKDQILELSKLNSQLLLDSKTKSAAAEKAAQECASFQTNAGESKKLIEKLQLQMKEYENLKQIRSKLEIENADLKKEISNQGVHITQQNSSQYDYVVLLEKKNTSLNKKIEELTSECAILRRQRDNFEERSSIMDNWKSLSPKKSKESSSPITTNLGSHSPKLTSSSQDSGHDNVNDNSITTALRKEINMLKNKLAEFSTQINEKSAFIDNIQPKLEVEQQQTRSLRLELHVCHDSLRNLKIEYDEMRKEFDSKLQANEQDIINLQNIIDYNNEIIAKMNGNTSKQSQINSSLENNSNIEITELKNKLKKAENEVEELFKANDELTNLLNESNSKNSSNDSHLMRERDLTQQVDTLKGKLKSIEAEIRGLKMEKDEDKGTLSSSKLNGGLLRDQIEDLKSQLRSNSPQSSLISSGIQDNDTALLNKRLKKADDQIAKLKAINKENQVAVAAYQRRDSELSHEIDELESKLVKSEDEIGNLRRELTFLRNDKRSQDLLSIPAPTMKRSKDNSSNNMIDINKPDEMRNDTNMLNIDLGIDLASPINDLHGAMGSFFSAASDTITAAAIFGASSTESNDKDILIQEYESKIQVLSQNLELMIGNSGNASVFVEECEKLAKEKRDIEGQVKKLRDLFETTSIDKKNIASDLVNANSKITDLEKEMKKVKAENSDLLYFKNIVNQEATENDYKNKYILSEERNIEYEKQVDIYSDKMKENQSKIIDLDRELHESNQNVMQLTVKLSDLSTRLQISNGIRDEKYILSNELNKVYDDINGKNKKLVELERNLENKNAEVELLKTKADESESSKKAIFQLKQEMNDLTLTNQRLGLISDEVDNLRKENSKSKLLITDLHIESEECKKENDQLKLKLKQYDLIKEQLSVANAKVYQLSSVNDALSHLQQNIKVDDYKGKYESSIQELQTTRYQVLELKTQIKDLHLTTDKLNNEIGVLQGRNYNDKNIFDNTTKLLLSGDAKIEDLKRALAELAEENMKLKSQLSQVLLSNNEGLKNAQTDLDVALKSNEDLNVANEEIRKYRNLLLEMQKVNAAVIYRCQLTGEVESLKKQILLDMFETHAKNNNINIQNSISPQIQNIIMSPSSLSEDEGSKSVSGRRGSFFPSNKPPSPVDNQPKKGLLRRVSSVFSSKMAFKQTDSESTASISVSTHTDTSPISENNNSQNFSLSTPNNNEPPQQRLSDLWDRLDVQAVEEQIETIDKRTIGNSNSYNDINETIPIEINDSALPVGNKADATAPQENNSLSLMGIGSFFTETINPLTYISPLSSPLPPSTAPSGETYNSNTVSPKTEERRSYNVGKKNDTKTKMRESRRHGRIPTENRSDVGSETGSMTDIPVIGGLFKAFS